MYASIDTIFRANLEYSNHFAVTNLFDIGYNFSIILGYVQSISSRRINDVIYTYSELNNHYIGLVIMLLG